MNDDYISGVRTSPMGPPRAVGLEYTEIVVHDLGRHPLKRANGDYNDFVPGYRGRVLGCLVICEEVTTDADADATIRPHINSTATTGGVVTVADTADAGNDFDTLWEIFQGTLVTGNNTFDAGDQVGIEYAATNAFSDGVARVIFVCEAYRA